MKSFGFSLIAFSFLVASQLKAQTITVSGASNYAIDEKDKKTVTINAGYAIPGNCSTESKNGTSTCNSCTGAMIVVDGASAQMPAPCNENGIYDTLYLTIQTESTNSDINGLNVGVSKTSDYTEGKISVTGTVETVNGKSFTISVPWSSIFTAFEKTTDCTTGTECSFTGSLYFGPVNENKFVETYTANLNVSVISYSSASSPGNGISKGIADQCPPRATGAFGSDQSSKGFCYFQMYPGDEKAYITDSIIGYSSSGKDASTNFQFTNLVMYYVERANPTSSDSKTLVQTALAQIKNNSSKALLEINTVEGDPLKDYKVSGLENSTTERTKSYCFLPALMDQTGNIQYFLDFNKITSATEFTDAQYTQLCASPSEVVGVLSDKNCFIATVAFGTRNHPYLDVLREFRNTFLHPNYLGKKFIKWYYSEGPKLAEEVKKHDWLVVGVKAALYPIIGVAFLLIRPKWVILFFVPMLVAFWIRRRAKL